MAQHWPCAQRYSDLIDLIIASNNDPNRRTYLNIFNDTRRTTYGLEKRLGNLIGERAAQDPAYSFDFLDMLFLDGAEMTARWMPQVPSMDDDQEWL